MKIAIQSGCGVEEFGPAKACKMYKEAGFQAIDWNMDTALRPNLIREGEFIGKTIFDKELNDIIDYYAEEIEEMHKNGLTIAQAHAPFPANVPDKPQVFDFMIEVYKKCILFCEHVGCKNLIIHGISPLWTDDEEQWKASREEADKLNWKLYNSLITTLLNTNVVVCLENAFVAWEGKFRGGHCADAYEAAEEIDRLNQAAGKECFGLCFDTGHLNLLKNDMVDYLRVIGKRLKALHIHDNDGTNDLHRAPYTGNIAWKDFCKVLAEVGYEGDLSFETFMQTTLKRVDEEMIIPWLKLIASCGEFFKNKINASR